MKQRDAGFDNLRGILIALVVVGHLLELCSFRGSGFAYRVIYSFHMPVFLFFSGYFARRGWKRLGFRLVLPYLAFQTVYLLFHAWMSGTPLPIQFAKPYWILWYLLVLVFYQLLLPLYDVADRRRQAAAVAAAFVLFWAVGYLSWVQYGLSLSRFFAFQPWFLLGFYTRKNGIPELPRKGRWAWSAALALLVAAGVWLLARSGVTGGMLYGSYPYATLGYGPLTRVFIGFLAFTWLAFLLLTVKPLLARPIPLLTELGRHTLPVFLLHGFALRFLSWRCPGLIQNPLHMLLTACGLLLLLGNPSVARGLEFCCSERWLDWLRAKVRGGDRALAGKGELCYNGGEVSLMNNEHIIFIPEEDQPYSDIVVTEGKYLFLSGLVSEDLSTRDEAYGSIEFETNRILDNLKVILERYGSDMDHVVKADVILARWADKDAMNGEYVKHFKKDRLPARICYGDVSIAGECKVEMAFIATKA